MIAAWPWFYGDFFKKDSCMYLGCGLKTFKLSMLGICCYGLS